MTASEFAALALALPGATEGSHFGKRDFRDVGGRIFASLPDEATAALKLTPDQQALMVEMHGGLFSPIPNAWGLKGWTHLALPPCPPDIARHALETACANLAAKAARGR